MKKIVAFAVFFFVLLNWGGFGGSLFSSPSYEPPTDKVVLYATQWCGYCQKTRELFAENNIKYVEYDIEKSERGYWEYKQLGGRGVPVVNARGTVIHGYEPGRILSAARSN